MHARSRNRWTLLGLLLTAVVYAPAVAAAQEYPSRAVRLIVPYAPGGPVDVVGRIIAKIMTEAIGENVYVDNRPGASGAMGTKGAVHAKPDGYTLLVGSTATISILPAIKPDIGYDPERDLIPISVVATGVHIFAVHPSVPVNDIRSFIDYAKSRQEPLAGAAGGVGTPDDLALHLLERNAGVTLAHVPYKGTGPAIADVVAGHVPVIAADASALLPYLEAGRLKPLGIASLKRNPLVPNIPTLDEQGLKGFESGGWFGIFAPVGVPPAVVDLLSKKVAAKLAEPGAREELRAVGLLPGSADARASATWIKKETEKWRALIASKNLRVD